MGRVDEALEGLLAAIRESEEYLDYRRQREKIDRQPELKEQIYIYREKNFELQNSAQGEELLRRLEEFDKEYETFVENPLVSDFLEAELAFCRMMQDINLRIAEEIDFE